MNEDDISPMIDPNNYPQLLDIDSLICDDFKDLNENLELFPYSFNVNYNEELKNDSSYLSNVDQFNNLIEATPSVESNFASFPPQTSSRCNSKTMEKQVIKQTKRKFSELRYFNITKEEGEYNNQLKRKMTDVSKLGTDEFTNGSKRKNTLGSPISCDIEGENGSKDIKQRRNRESAKKCRARKKEYIQSLEMQLREVKDELADCKIQLEMLKNGIAINLIEEFCKVNGDLLFQARDIIETDVPNFKLNNIVHELAVSFFF